MPAQARRRKTKGRVRRLQGQVVGGDNPLLDPSLWRLITGKGLQVAPGNFAVAPASFTRAGRSGQRPRPPPPALPVRIGRYCPCVGKLNSKRASGTIGDGTGASRPGAVTPRLARTPAETPGESARVGLPGLQCSAGALLRGSSELINK
jgi:hypothetical protein